jgi:SAM-dependent methyltransferase
MPRWCDRLFESVRLTLDKEQGEAKAIAHEEVDCLLQVCSLKPDERILDLYCGQGYHAMDLAARGFCDIVGVERPGCGIRTARRRARIEGFSVPLIEADPRRCSFNPSYDVVLMLGNSLGRFVDEEDAAALLETCRRALQPSGSCFCLSPTSIGSVTTSSP